MGFSKQTYFYLMFPMKVSFLQL